MRVQAIRLCHLTLKKVFFVAPKEPNVSQIYCTVHFSTCPYHTDTLYNLHFSLFSSGCLLLFFDTLNRKISRKKTRPDRHKPETESSPPSVQKKSEPLLVFFLNGIIHTMYFCDCDVLHNVCLFSALLYPCPHRW